MGSTDLKNIKERVHDSKHVTMYNVTDNIFLLYRQQNNPAVLNNIESFIM